MERNMTQEAEKIIESIEIPSQPKIIMAITEEVLKPEQNFRKIRDLVSQDISMSAKILKVANSSFFSVEKEIVSIQAALSLLGLNNFTDIVLTSTLRDVYKDFQLDANDLEAIFDHSTLVAKTSQLICQKIRYLDSGIVFDSQVYMAGLFHDIGILIMAKRFPDYFNKIRTFCNENNPLIAIEEENYKTNHCMVGHLMGKKWKLPPFVCDIIVYHHDSDFEACDEISSNKILQIIMLAEILNNYIFEHEFKNISLYANEIHSASIINNLFEILNLNKEDRKDLLNKIMDYL